MIAIVCLAAIENQHDISRVLIDSPRPMLLRKQPGVGCCRSIDTSLANLALISNSIGLR